MEKNIMGLAGEIKIFIDDKEYILTQSAISGSELRKLAGMDSSYELWQVISGPSNDKFVETYDIINIEQDMHFFSGRKTINPSR